MAKTKVFKLLVFSYFAGAGGKERYMEFESKTVNIDVKSPNGLIIFFCLKECKIKRTVPLDVIHLKMNVLKQI